MDKRIIKLIIGGAVSAILCTALILVGVFTGGVTYEAPSETFKGMVSNDSYNSKAETLKAFVYDELSGATSDPEYVGFEEKGALTQEELSELDLSQDEKYDVEKAERVVVYYSDNQQNKKINTYVLKTKSGYKYYVPPTLLGEALTKTYFESVLDGAKYINCTSDTTVNLRSTKDGVDSTYRQVIKLATNISHMDQAFPGMDYEFYLAERPNDSIEIYLNHPSKNDGKFYTLSEVNSDMLSQNLKYEVYLMKCGEKINLSEMKTLQDITDFMFMMPVDASYFVKTDKGFSMPNEKYKDVCKLMSGENAYDEIENAWDKYHINFHADYYVTDGRLSGSETVLTMSDGVDVFALCITVRYVDFGSTEVQLPTSEEE